MEQHSSSQIQVAVSPRTFEDIFGCLDSGECYWPLVDTNQDAAKHPITTTITIACPQQRNIWSKMSIVLRLRSPEIAHKTTKRNPTINQISFTCQHERKLFEEIKDFIIHHSYTSSEEIKGGRGGSKQTTNDLKVPLNSILILHRN